MTIEYMRRLHSLVVAVAVAASPVACTDPIDPRAPVPAAEARLVTAAQLCGPPPANPFGWAGRCWYISAAAGQDRTQFPKDAHPLFDWDPALVRVDAQGRLLLGLQWNGAGWRGAQIKSVAVDASGNYSGDDRFGFGTFRFDLESPLAPPHPSAVFGFFLIGNNPPPLPGTDEIDIELTRWGVSMGSNTWYTVYGPNGLAGVCGTLGTCKNFAQRTLPDTWSGVRTYQFRWRAGQVMYAPACGTTGCRDSVPKTPDVRAVSARPMPLVLNTWMHNTGPTLGSQPQRISWRRLKGLTILPDPLATATLTVTVRGANCALSVNPPPIRIFNALGSVADNIARDTVLRDLAPGEYYAKASNISCNGQALLPTFSPRSIVLSAASSAQLAITYAPVAWTSAADMPIAREGMHTVVLNGRVYLMGGAPDPTRVDVYDPTTDSWTSAVGLSIALSQGGGSASLNGKIYFPYQPIGGAFDVATYELDPATFGMRLVQSIAGFSHACGRALAHNGKLLVQGNLTSSYFFTNYDVASATPSYQGLYPPSGHSCAPIYGIAGGRLWVGGGFADQGSLGQQPLTQVVSLDLSAVSGGPVQWRVEPSLFRAHLAGAGVAYNDRIIVVGGDCGDPTCVNADAVALDVFGSATGWSSFPNPLVRRRSHSAAVVGNVLYVFGGSAFDAVTKTYLGMTRSVERIALP